MKVTITHTEYRRNGRAVEVVDGSVSINGETSSALKRAAREYRTSSAGMIAIVLAYYFGDGANHLGCSDCGFWFLDDSQGVKRACDGCEPGGSVPLRGVQTTLPLLDKGSVVVGKPSTDQGV